MKSYEVAVDTHKMRTDAAKKRFKDVLKKDPAAPPPMLEREPDEPKPRRYIVDDATYEALGVILVNNPNGVLAFRDELVSLLRTLDREEYAAARGFFLAAWNGKDGYTFDRIIRGTHHIEAACVSLLGATQPSKIADFVKRSVDGGLGDDGMIQRFSLAVWPDGVGWREVDRYADSEAKQAAFDVFDRLDKLQPSAVGAVKGAFDRDSVPQVQRRSAGGVFRLGTNTSNDPSCATTISRRRSRAISRNTGSSFRRWRLSTSWPTAAKARSIATPWCVRSALAATSKPTPAAFMAPASKTKRRRRRS